MMSQVISMVAPPPEVTAALRKDLGRLDSAVLGLGERTVSFVLTGTPESVPRACACSGRDVTRP